MISPRAMTQAEMLDEIRHVLGFGPTAELRDMHYSALVYLAGALARPHGGGRANLVGAERLAKLLEALWHEMDYGRNVSDHARSARVR